MDKKLQQQLQPHRQEIDAVDREILNLLNTRADLAKKIGTLKGTAAVYSPEREAEVLNRLKKYNKGPLTAAFITRLFREIMSECLVLERPLTVAYLGPEGTFSQQAVRRQFGQAAVTRAYPSIDDAFSAVENKKADCVVAPVENSGEGAVGRTLDLLIKSPLIAYGEITLKIHHNLMAKNPDPTRINKVYAHPQALAQCHSWLRDSLPAAELIPASSNAAAARLAGEENNAAAIAAAIAAEIYGLNILYRNIENEADNYTRFLVLGQQKTRPTGQDKTSLIISTPNKAGAMYHLLAPFARHKISMRKLESRPARGGLWEYVFFIDIEGHINDEKVQAALTELKEHTIFIKWLGSYPLSPL